MSRSLYLPRSSGWHSLHPLTKLMAVVAIVLVAFSGRWVHLPFALFLIVVLPLAAWGRIAQAVLRVTLAVILPFAVSILVIQGLFYPGASQTLFALGPLAFKQEGLVFAYGTAGKILVLSGAGLLLLLSTQPSDLMQALTERGMPRAIAYIVVAAIQMLPQMQARANSILDAQRARGLETEGFILNRVRAMIPLIGPLVFSTLGEVDERSMALEARAYNSIGRKTSFRELRDTRAQWYARWVMVAATVIVFAVGLVSR